MSSEPIVFVGPMLRAKLAVARAVVAGEEAAPEGATTLIGSYWETVASLVRARHVDGRIVYESVGGGTPFGWAAVAGCPRRGARAASKVALARPTGVGRALATYEIPIEGRDEWLAAARHLA